MNRRRDIATEQKLIAAGWRVITVWECEIRRMKNIDFLIERITAQLL